MVQGADFDPGLNEAAGAAGGAEGGGGEGGDGKRRGGTGRPSGQPTGIEADEELAIWEQWSMLQDLLFGSNGNGSEVVDASSFEELFDRFAMALGGGPDSRDNLPQEGGHPTYDGGYDIWEHRHILGDLILGSGLDGDMEGSFEHMYARLVFDGGAAADDNLPAEDGEGDGEGDHPTQQQ